MAIKKKLKIRDIEELENTSVATVLAANAVDVVRDGAIVGTCQQNSVCENTVACVGIGVCGLSCLNTCCVECSIGTCVCTMDCTLASCDAGTICACTNENTCNEVSACAFDSKDAVLAK